MAIKLYRCKNLWVKAGGHPCWRVQSALDEQGIEYELVTGAWPAIGKRHEIEQLSGQTKYPVIQFEVAAQILATGLVPIVEPEVDIHCPEKAAAEALLKGAILEKLDKLPVGQWVMVKITLPERDDFYADCVKHPKVLKVVALSGGYSRQEGNDRLRRNHGVVASFSRALVEGLSAQQSDAEFDAMLDGAIQSIFEASIS